MNLSKTVFDKYNKCLYRKEKVKDCQSKVFGYAWHIYFNMQAHTKYWYWKCVIVKKLLP